MYKLTSFYSTFIKVCCVLLIPLYFSACEMEKESEYTLRNIEKVLSENHRFTLSNDQSVDRDSIFNKNESIIEKIRLLTFNQTNKKEHNLSIYLIKYTDGHAAVSNDAIDQVNLLSGKLGYSRKATGGDTRLLIYSTTLSKSDLDKIVNDLSVNYSNLLYE